MLRSLLLFWVGFIVSTLESLLETAAHGVPLFTVRVTDDGFVWGNFDIVRESEPVISADDNV